MIFEFFGPIRTYSGLKSFSVKISEPLLLLDALRLLPDRVREVIMDNDGKIRPGILILVNEIDARSVYGFNLHVRDEDKITIIPLIHGGVEQC